MKKIVLLLLFLSATASSADAVSLMHHFETDDGFSISLPYGWYSVPTMQMEALNFYATNAIDQTSPLVMKYGYHKGTGSSIFTAPPYIFIGVNSTERVTESDIKNIKSMRKKIENDLQVINDDNDPDSNMYLEKIWYDETTKAFYSVAIMEASNNRRVKAFSSTLLTAKGSIELTYFADDKNYENELNIFQEITTAVSFNDDMVFTPAFSDNFIFINRLYKAATKNKKRLAIGALLFCLVLWGIRQKYFKSY